MTITVERLSGEQIEDRKAKIVSAIGSSVDELKKKAAFYALDSEERAALQEIEDLEYLENPGG